MSIMLNLRSYLQFFDLAKAMWSGFLLPILSFWDLDVCLCTRYFPTIGRLVKRWCYSAWWDGYVIIRGGIHYNKKVDLGVMHENVNHRPWGSARECQPSGIWTYSRQSKIHHTLCWRRWHQKGSVLCYKNIDMNLVYQLWHRMDGPLRPLVNYPNTLRQLEIAVDKLQ